MRKLSATDAARNFSALLDEVERHGETFVVVRRGRAVARIGPIGTGNGKAVKELLRASMPDSEWERDLDEIRALLRS